MDSTTLIIIIFISAVIVGGLLFLVRRSRNSSVGGGTGPMPPLSTRPASRSEDKKKADIDIVEVEPLPRGGGIFRGGRSSGGAAYEVPPEPQPTAPPPQPAQVNKPVPPPAPPSPMPHVSTGTFGGVSPKEAEIEEEIDFDDDVDSFGGGEPYSPEPEKPEEASEITDILKLDRRAEAGEGADESVQFSAYFPREAQPDTWASLTAYIYKAFAEGKVVADAQAHTAPASRQVGEAARQPIAEGAMVTATPNLPGMQVNPPSQSIYFYEDWHRFEFKVRPKEAPLNLAVNGSLTFMVEGIIVADLPLSVYVTDQPSAQDEPAASTTQPAYNAIFCSYSHDDTPIVQRVERAYKALGMDYLRDLYSIRSGEDWNDKLLALIEQADIFQLFWSEKSSISKHVETEWRHALNLLATRPGFIRPVYWQQPIPHVPDELSHIHFAYQPDLSGD